MKRLIPAGILLLLVILSYALSLTYITKSCDKTKDLINQSIEIYSQNKTAENKTKEIKEYWQKEEKMLSFFVNHTHIDKIEQAISTLNIYAKEEDNVLFYEYADLIKVMLHQIEEETRITVHSIF